MKYTMSSDGIDRCNVRLTLRFTRDDIKAIKDAAIAQGIDWRQWLESHAALGVEEHLIARGGN